MWKTLQNKQRKKIEFSIKQNFSEYLQNVYVVQEVGRNVKGTSEN